MFTRLIIAVSVLSNVLMANPYVDAGERQNIDPWMIYSVAKVESGNNPLALNKNRNGTYDIGIMQINTVHLPILAKYGISRDDLWNPETNIHVGAWVLGGCIKKHGYTTKALDCYNGDKTGRYSKKVLNMFYKETRQYALANE